MATGDVNVLMVAAVTAMDNVNVLRDLLANIADSVSGQISAIDWQLINCTGLKSSS